MTTFSELIHGITAQDGAAVGAIPESWRQGRTTYGGLTAALCVDAALRVLPDLPPLRSAQFAFIGPAAGVVRATPAVLRQGKNSVFVAVDLVAETGLATRGLLCFAAARNSGLAHLARPMPDAGIPGDGDNIFPASHGPAFAAQFDLKRAGAHGLMTQAPDPDLLVWIRHKDKAGRRGIVGAIALADALPPAAMTMFGSPAPISTMTWAVDVIHPELAEAGSDEGWHLMQSRGDHVADGYSSQDMVLWTGTGVPLLIGRQTVAVFT